MPSAEEERAVLRTTTTRRPRATTPRRTTTTPTPNPWRWRRRRLRRRRRRLRRRRRRSDSPAPPYPPPRIARRTLTLTLTLPPARPLILTLAPAILPRPISPPPPPTRRTGRSRGRVGPRRSLRLRRRDPDGCGGPRPRAGGVVRLRGAAASRLRLRRVAAAVPAAVDRRGRDHHPPRLPRLHVAARHDVRLAPVRHRALLRGDEEAAPVRVHQEPADREAPPPQEEVPELRQPDQHDGKDFAFKSAHEQAIFEIARNIWRPGIKRSRDSDDDENEDLNPPTNDADPNHAIVVADGPLSSDRRVLRTRRRLRRRTTEESAAVAADTGAGTAVPVMVTVENSIPPPQTPSVQPATVPGIIEETVKSCLSPLFKELINSAIGGGPQLSSGLLGGGGLLGLLGVSPPSMNIGGNLGSNSSGTPPVDEKWRKQQILELEVYLKRIELVQEQIKLTLEELKKPGVS
uniref:Uncharacterized protein n=1 Tax=Ananas comosus var. bracteatus TaxID=296719 RepID=A0A6V7QB91_ANACO|nr:unnamed protein product [Ananas comosus var. bracteatus]